MVACVLIERFALACELETHHELQGKPLALVSQDGRVKVASAEAVERGVAPGQLLSAAKALCPMLLAKPYDAPAYLARAESV